MINVNTPKNYTGTESVQLSWNSYDSNHPDRVTVASLFKLARDHGWPGPRNATASTQQPLPVIPSRLSRTTTALFELPEGDVHILSRPPAKREYILADVVMAGTYGILAGSGATMKTTLLMTTAAAMAIGQCLGDIQIAQGASMLFLGEEDHAEVSRRLSSICAYYGYAPLMVENLVKAFPAAGMDLRLTRNVGGSLEASSLMDNVIEMARQHEQTCGAPVRLIVFDHARLIMDGDPDDASHVTQLTRVLTTIAKSTGAAVMLLAHSPKSVLKLEAHEMSIADVAGSSAFSDNARSGFIMYGMRKDDAKAYQISEPDRKKYVKLECAKANYGAQGVWWFERVTLDDWQTAVLKPVTLTAQLFGPGKAKQQLRQRILDLLTSAPRSARAIRDRAGQKGPLGASEKEVSAAVEALLEEGRIERRKPTPTEVAQRRLSKGRELLFVVPIQP